MNKFFLPAERAAKDRTDEPSKTIVQLLDEIRADADIVAAPHWSDGNKLRDGIIGRAAEKMVSYASQYRVKSDELERKTAEMTNAVAYYTAGAQRDQHQRMYDFYYIHCVNCSIFFGSFLKQPWIREANKVRLLQWKVWNDLAMYASRKCPAIRMDLVRDYQPKKPSGWDAIEDRVIAMEDDGHAAKLVRALAHGQKVCRPYEDREEFRVKHDDWLQMGHMAIDAVEAGEPHWVRSAGFDEAWGESLLHSDCRGHANFENREDTASIAALAPARLPHNRNIKTASRNSRSMVFSGGLKIRNPVFSSAHTCWSASGLA